MLCTLNDILPQAREKGYGVGLFNTVHLEMARGVIRAAEETGSPVIIGTAEVLLPSGPLEELSYFLIPMAKKAKVPVVVHFDHGLQEETCKKALELGFSSIMYDCSNLGYEENLKKVKEMAYLAHSCGATIEGELGHVGNTDDDEEAMLDPSRFYTDPQQALEFVNETKVDCLAIAVGTAHGAYKLPPKLDFARITRIRDTVPVPLVLHGGSGLTDEDFRRAIQSGISKVNIFTDLNLAAAKAAYDGYAAGKTAMTAVIPDIVEAVYAETKKKMTVFACK